MIETKFENLFMITVIVIQYNLGFLLKINNKILA